MSQWPSGSPKILQTLRMTYKGKLPHLNSKAESQNIHSSHSYLYFTYRYIDTIFEEANACLKNSLVPMRLVHHGTYAYPGEEYRAASTMLDSFAGLQKTPVMYNGVEYYSVKPNRTHRYWPRFNHCTG